MGFRNFVERVPARLLKIGASVSLPETDTTIGVALVVEVRGSHVVVEMKDGRRLIGRFGNGDFDGAFYEGIWVYTEEKPKP